MFAVVVTFTIKNDQFDRFMPLMLANARASLAHEDGCHQFDVCTDSARVNKVFLYELYTDADAFQVHLASAHFQSFNAETSDMLAAKDVRTFAHVAQ